MYNTLKYVNHLNQEVIFSYKGFYETGILIEKDSLRDYEYEYDVVFEKVTNFRKEIKEYSLPVSIHADNANEIANNIHAIFESDVMTGNRGRLYLGDYYIEGFFYGSEKRIVTHERLCSMNLMFVSDSEDWTNEQTYVYRADSREEGDGHDYPYDYPYNYLSRISAKSIYNDTYKPQDMIITIYGSTNAPIISIGGNDYGANVELLSGEILTVNTREKTVLKTNRIGEKINCFAQRVRTNYPFEKLKVGPNLIVSPNTANFDVLVLVERSEPEWI